MKYLSLALLLTVFLSCKQTKPVTWVVMEIDNISPDSCKYSLLFEEEQQYIGRIKLDYQYHFDTCGKWIVLDTIGEDQYTCKIYEDSIISGTNN